MGALWITPEQLIYWGDSEEFSVTPEQLVRLERRSGRGKLLDARRRDACDSAHAHCHRRGASACGWRMDDVRNAQADGPFGRNDRQLARRGGIRDQESRVMT